GGVILETNSERRLLRTHARLEFLKARAAAPHDLGILIQSLLVRDGIVPRETLLIQSSFSADEIKDATAALIADRKAVIVSNWVVGIESWSRRLDAASAAIDGFHKKHPDRTGMPLQDLRVDIENQFRAPDFFEPLMD